MILARKLARDLARHAGQAVMLALVFALGVAAFVGIRSAFAGLAPATQDLYDRLGLPDLVARVSYAPSTVVDQVRQLPNVVVAEGRVALTTTAVSHPGVAVRVVGLPLGSSPALGASDVVAGRGFSGAAGEALVAETAVAAHGLPVGSTLRLRGPGDEVVDLTVVGTARQPEHLAMIPEGGFMAMPRSFMVVFVPTVTAERLLGRQDGVTEITIELEEPAMADDTIANVRSLLRRYRVDVVRGDELDSVRNVRAHLEALAGAAVVFPLLFLVAGSLGGLILLSRVVHRERGLIGLLRATGFGRGRIALHYVSYTLVLAATGASVGVPFGVPLARFVRRIFAADLGTPVEAGLWHPGIALLAVGTALVGGVAAGAVPALRAARLAPAEAMRLAAPPTPRVFDLRFAARAASPMLVMTLRNLLRRPARSVLAILGIAFAVILAAAPALVLAETELVQSSVQAVRRYDLNVVPRGPRGEAWLDVLRELQGVARVEPILEFPVDAALGSSIVRTYVLGLGTTSTLIDVPVPEPGHAFLARGLPADGGPVSLRGPLGEIVLPVGGQVAYPLGRPVVLTLQDARRLVTPPAVIGDAFGLLFGIGLPTLEDPITAALVAVADDAPRGFVEGLRSRSDVARVEDRASENADLDRIFSLTRAFIGVIEVFAVLLGFALVYNTVAVSALERRRELVTLRVLGFEHGQIARLFRLEVVITVLVAAFPAIPIALWFARVAMRDFGDFLPTGIGLRPVPIAAVVVGLLVTALAATVPVLRDLRRVSLADEMRVRE